MNDIVEISNTLREINSYHDLQQNWDGYNSPAPQQCLIHTAVILYHKLKKRVS